MANRAYTDMEALRQDVQALIQAKRIQWTKHARQAHVEISPNEKLVILRSASGHQPNRQGLRDEPSYVCWARHSVHGLCRAVFAIRATRQGPHLFVITVFKED